MNKRRVKLLLVWLVLNFILSLFWPYIKKSAEALRPYPGYGGIGGESFLWLVPSEIVFALSMLKKRKGRCDG